MIPDGTKVKLTKAYARVRMKGSKMDWINRRGVVQHTTKRGEVLVIWDGNKAPEINDERALEIVE